MQLDRENILILLEQEEERVNGFDQFDKIGKKLSVFYMTDWDGQMKSYHASLFPSARRHYLDDVSWISREEVSNKTISEIEIILKKGPIPLTVRSLANNSQDFLKPYHNRFYIETPKYEDFILKLCSLHLHLVKLQSEHEFSIVVAPFKHGWQRKYASYFFMAKGVRVLHLTDLRYDGRFSIEEWKSGKIRFIGALSQEMFVSNPKIKAVNQINVGGYRARESLNHKRFGKGWIYRKIASRFKISTIMIIKRIILMVRWKLGERDSGRSLRGLHDISHHVKYIVWDLVTLANMMFDLFIIAFDRRDIKAITSDRPYVLVALHYFPESSTVGEYGYVKSEVEYFSDILDIYDKVFNIIVVDHPTMIFAGERPRWQKEFFRQHAGVVYFPLIDFDGIDLKIIADAEEVITISGGIAVEKALTMRGRAKISVLHPMLCIDTISLLETTKNSQFCMQQFNEKIGHYSVTQYCIESSQKGFLLSAFFDEFLNYVERYECA